MKDLGRWQREFSAQPKIWVVEDDEGNVCNFYDSKAAAKLETEWMKSRRHLGKVRIMAYNVHSLKLAEERWRE